MQDVFYRFLSREGPRGAFKGTLEVAFKIQLQLRWRAILANVLYPTHSYSPPPQPFLGPEQVPFLR